MSLDDAILRRLAARLARAAAADDGHGAVQATARPAPVSAAAPAGSVGTRTERFVRAWQALAGTVHEARSAADVAEVVAGICRIHDASRVLSWSETDLGVPGVTEALARLEIGVDHGWLPVDAAQRAARLTALERLAVGVTGASGGIAESGTVALVSGPGRSRLASLLPPVHVTLLHVDRIHESLPDLLAAEPSLVEAGSNLVLVTGPSRTADIEMTLTRGVHGPGHVHVVLIHPR